MSWIRRPIQFVSPSAPVCCSTQLLVDNITDSWLLAPTLLCFFTPSFITNIGCVYAGLVVPSFNSIKVGADLLSSKSHGILNRGRLQT